MKNLQTVRNQAASEGFVAHALNAHNRNWLISNSIHKSSKSNESSNSQENLKKIGKHLEDPENLTPENRQLLLSPNKSLHAHIFRIQIKMYFLCIPMVTCKKYFSKLIPNSVDFSSSSIDLVPYVMSEFKFPSWTNRQKPLKASYKKSFWARM